MGMPLRLCGLSLVLLAICGTGPTSWALERGDASESSPRPLAKPPATGIPRDLLSQLGKAGRATPRDRPPSRACDSCLVPAKYRTFAGFLRWTGDYSNDLWRRAARRANKKWRPARIVVVSSASVQSRGCGIVTALLSPPSYCPRDRGGTIYIPEGRTREIVFMDKAKPSGHDWRERDFAFAYVVAHEWGHHAQEVLGYPKRRLSLRIELQADCFAGIWAYRAWTDKLLEPGDIRAAMRTMHHIGEPSGSPNATDAHGTSAQRKERFLRGYRSGSFERCDTSTVATAGRKESQ